MYYTKSKKDRESENKIETSQRCLPTGLLVAVILVGGFMFMDGGACPRNSKILLKEDFWE